MANFLLLGNPETCLVERVIQQISPEQIENLERQQRSTMQLLLALRFDDPHMSELMRNEEYRLTLSGRDRLFALKYFFCAGWNSYMHEIGNTDIGPLKGPASSMVLANGTIDNHSLSQGGLQAINAIEEGTMIEAVARMDVLEKARIDCHAGLLALLGDGWNAAVRFMSE